MHLESGFCEGKNATPFSRTFKEGTRTARSTLLTKQPDDTISSPGDQQVPVVIEGCAVDGNGFWIQGELELVKKKKKLNLKM